MKALQFLMLILILLTVLTSPVRSEVPDDNSHKASSESYRLVEVTYRSEGMDFVAMLFLPEGEGARPGVILIQGAGDSSRKNVWSLMIGEQLALRGIPVLVPDKRGTGDSGGDWKTANFDDLARDIKAAVKYLVGRPEVDSNSVGVVGLSQGGFYAPIVAEGFQLVSFVAAVSSSVLTFEETVNHEMANTFREQGLTSTAHGQAMAVQTAAIQYVRGGKWQDYESARTMALRGEAGKAMAVAEFPSQADHWLWEWVKNVVDFDPMPHWQRVSQPIFFAYGAADEHENVPVSASVSRILADLAPDHDVVLHVYSESGHALYDPVIAREKREAEIRADFAEDLANWIKNRVERSPTHK